MSLSNLQLRKRYNRRIGKFLSKLSPIVYGFKYLKVADSDKVIEINVEDIVGWYKKDNRNELIFKGKIKPGNWPSNIRNKDLVLDKSEKYKSIKERFLQGYEWEETSIFKGRYKKKMEQYGHSAGLKILIEKAEEYRKYDRLFERIKKDNALKPPGNGIRPMYVSILPDGKFAYSSDGNHRLYMAMILGIKKIPVQVLVRHEEWQKKRDLILSDQTTDEAKEVREKFKNHPDIISEL